MLHFKPEILFKDPKKLIPYQDNAKLHPPEQIKEIAEQVVNFGFDQPIVITKDNVIIKGHGRLQAALLLGLKSVPVIVSTLDDFKAMAARIGDNKSAETGWDEDVLKLEFEKLKRNEIDLKLTSFEVPEIESIESAWVPDQKALDSVQETSDPAKAVIRVKCEPAQEDLVKLVIIEALRAAGLLMTVDII